MITRKLLIENFMPFKGKHTLEFPAEADIFAVVAEYEGEPGRSNRGGKSSFLDAIVWCRYGKSRAQREAELVHDGEEECRVVETLEDESGRQTTITRVRRSDGTGQLELAGLEGEKKRATQPEIDRLLGMNYEEFLNTRFFKQNEIDQFMRATPQEKKQLMQRWMQQTAWPTYEGAAGEYLKELQRLRENVKAQIEALGDGAFDKDEMIARKRELDSAVEELKAEIEEVSQAKQAAELRLVQLKDSDAVLAKAQECMAKAKRLRAQRPDSSGYAARLKQLEDNLAKWPAVDDAKADEYRHKRNEAVRLLGEAGLKLRQLNEEKARSKRDMTGTCPILKEACDRIKLTPAYLQDLDSQITACMEKQKKLTDARDKCEKWVTLSERQKQWTAEREQLYEKANMARQIEEQVAALEHEHDELMATVPENCNTMQLEIKRELETLDAQGRAAVSRMANCNRDLGALAEAFKAGKRSAERKAELQAHLQELDVRINDATYVTYMFGKNGIPSIELENSFGEIENEANVVLKRLRAPFRVEFQATRELQDWEANCLACGTVYERGTRTHQCKKCGTPREKKRRDELSLRVLENGRERAFYLDSGGGQVLLSVGMRIALARLAQRNTGQTGGALFLDEVFGQLDPVNRKAMADLVTGTLVRDFGFKQVFVISHVPGIQSAVADTVKVFRRKAGHSEVSLQ